MSQKSMGFPAPSLLYNCGIKFSGSQLFLNSLGISDLFELHITRIFARLKSLFNLLIHNYTNCKTKPYQCNLNVFPPRVLIQLLKLWQPHFAPSQKISLTKWINPWETRPFARTPSFPFFPLKHIAYVSWKDMCVCLRPFNTSRQSAKN